MMSMLPLLVAILLLRGGSETASALLVEHGGVGLGSLRPHHNSRAKATCHALHAPPYISPLLSTSSNAVSNTSRITRTRELALQMMEENAMPTDVDDDGLSGEYDEDYTTPIESEFSNFISTFLDYSERDIQSCTTTSTRYLNYQEDNSKKNARRARRRTKEEGIRYRTLYAGVQAAALDPEVIRAFTVLFEDYLPIRLAGRRIYAHLKNVMEEVREERRGEIARAREVCPDWDCKLDTGEDAIEHARCIWDAIMDEALLLEHSLESADVEEQSQEGGVVSLPQLIQLGVDQVLMQQGLVSSSAELERIVRQAAVQDEKDITEGDNYGKTRDSENGQYLEVTFAIFMKVLYECCSQNRRQSVSDLVATLQKLEQTAHDHRTTTGRGDKDTSTLLAAKAVVSGSISSCKKRKKFSDRFDEYVSKFQLWESKFMTKGNADVEEEEQQHSRRFEILRGCFVGARNEKNVAALKIVYMDYAALRVGGDLIFSLMSKIVNKFM